jgi:hypothetical protein
MFPNATARIYREMPNGTVIGIKEDGTEELLECPMTGYDQQSECLHLVGEYIVDFQAGSSRELQQQYGHITQSMYTLYIDDPSIEIKYNDKVKIVGVKGCYQVMGDPYYYRTILPHIEVPLMKER